MERGLELTQTAGVRPMLVGAALGTGAMGAWEAFKTFV